MGNCQDNNCKSYLEQHNLITNTQVNVIDQIHNEFIVLQENENQYDPLYGYIDILEFKEQNKSGFKLAHKTHMFYDIDKYKRALKFYETRFHGMNHPNLLIIHAIQNKQIDQFFNSEYKISLFLDYPIRSFQQEILYRKKMYFDESEILYFMDSVIGALAFLQSKGVPYKNVRLENVYLVQLLNGNLGIKLQFPEINQKSFMHELLTIVSQEKRFDYQHYPYLSPEQLAILRNKKMEQYDEFKSDVFTLGLIILELCTVRKSIYIYEEFQIDQLLLNDQIVKLEDKYSEQIGLILKAMLQFDPRVRQDFIDLDDLLNSSSLKGKRIAQNWSIEDYQYCVNDQPKKVHFQTKQLSLLHPELGSQMSNQSNFKQENVKGSHLSIKQVLSKNSKESRASSSNVRGKEVYSPGKQNALFKKYDTELASKGGSKKLIQATDGFGIECDANGLTYEGNYQAGKRHGEGKLLNDENEVIYEGNFQENLFHKYGSLKNTEKLILTEPFNYKDFNTLGQGWSRYDGVFQMGQKHGHGQLVLTNTERFVGQFENDMLNGPGTFHTLNGAVIQGEWKLNQLI